MDSLPVEWRRVSICSTHAPDSYYQIKTCNINQTFKYTVTYDIQKSSNTLLNVYSPSCSKPEYLTKVTFNRILTLLFSKPQKGMVGDYTRMTMRPNVIGSH